MTADTFQTKYYNIKTPSFDITLRDKSHRDVFKGAAHVLGAGKLFKLSRLTMGFLSFTLSFTNIMKIRTISSYILWIAIYSFAVDNYHW